MPKAVEAARRAVALDPLLAEAHSALAVTSLLYTWDRAEAEREFARSMELNPKDVQVLHWYAYFCLQLSEGRLTEGMEQAKLALASDPLSGTAHAVYALTCAIAGNTAESVEASRRAVQLDSENLFANWVLQEALLSSGQFEASVAAGETAFGRVRPAPLVHALARRGSRKLGQNR
jgi:Tfp pilus assembly protein PilF